MQKNDAACVEDLLSLVLSLQAKLKILVVNPCLKYLPSQELSLRQLLNLLNLFQSFFLELLSL